MVTRLVASTNTPPCTYLGIQSFIDTEYVIVSFKGAMGEQTKFRGLLFCLPA